MVKAWRKTMETIALSSGESELGAVVKGTAEALGLKSILADFGFDAKVRLRSDATAAIGMVLRQGLGRVRHLATSDLWVQQKAKNRYIEVEKLPGPQNPADLMTKHKNRASSRLFLEMLQFVSLDGRPSVSPLRTSGWNVAQPYILPKGG